MGPLGAASADVNGTNLAGKPSKVSMVTALPCHLTTQ
jgi:hypothetical protein